MRGLKTLAVLLFLVTLASADENVTFKFLPLKVGQRSEDHFRSDSQMTIRVLRSGQQARVLNVSISQTKNKTETVLAQDGGLVTRLRVHFDKVDKTETMAGRDPKTTLQPVSGKTYVIEWKAGQLHITDEQGISPGEEELEILKKEYRRLGRPDPMSKFLDKKTFRTGEAISVPDEVTEDLFGEESGDKKLSIVLKGTVLHGGVRCAILDVAMKMSQKDEATVVTTDLHGQMLLDIGTLRILSAEMQGPITVTGTAQDKAEQKEITGTMKMSVQEVYP
jgi:hypothetical protein